jgi:hypothetical protein
VAALADHHLVQRRERLTVVGAHLHHRALADRCGSRLRGCGEGDSCRGGVRHEHPGIDAGQRVDADDGLDAEVLRGVGDEPVLSDDEHDVVGFEDEAGEVAAFDRGSPPIDRQPADTSARAARVRSCRSSTAARLWPR